MQGLQREEELSSGILHGSGDVEPCRTAVAGLKRALPIHEFASVSAWLSTFFGYQQRWLLDWSRFSVLVKSRQIGASHTYAGAAALWGILGEGTSIVSVGEREAGEVLQKVHLHCKALERLGSKWAAPLSKSATTIRLASGAVIVSLPSTSGARGRSANVLLDEAAYLPFAEETWDAASASTMHGFKLRVMSTPNGAGGLFYDLWSNPKTNSGFTLHSVTLDEARADGLKVDEGECWKMSRGDPRLFDQLFRCSFLDNELQYIPTEAIELCRSGGDLTRSDGGDHYAGLDIGREHDLSVLIVVRFHRGIRTVVHVESMKRTDFDEMESRVSRAFEKYQLKRLCIDQTGIGMASAERLKKKHSERVDVAHRRPRVEPIMFTLKSKEMLATGLYSAMTAGQVVLPRTDEALPGCDAGTAKMLSTDIAAIRRIVTSAGNVSYDAPRTAEGHADSAWALALAVHASTGRNAMAEALLGNK